MNYRIALLALILACVTWAGPIDSCGTTRSFPLQPVPVSGTITCGPLTFANFSSNILSGGMIAASYTIGVPPAPDGGLADFVHFVVQPNSPAAGWSYSATATTSGVGWISLPKLTYVTSGSPTVTEHFCTSSPCTNDNYLAAGALTATASAGSGYAPAYRGTATIYVQVNSSDITGGTISALETVFVTPEPVSALLVFIGLALLFATGKGRQRKADVGVGG